MADQRMVYLFRDMQQTKLQEDNKFHMQNSGKFFRSPGKGVHFVEGVVIWPKSLFPMRNGYQITYWNLVKEEDISVTWHNLC